MTEQIVTPTSPPPPGAGTPPPQGSSFASVPHPGMDPQQGTAPQPIAQNTGEPQGFNQAIADVVPEQPPKPAEIDYSQIDPSKIDWSKVEGVKWSDIPAFREYSSAADKAAEKRAREAEQTYQAQLQQQQQAFQQQMQMQQQQLQQFVPEEQRTQMQMAQQQYQNDMLTQQLQVFQQQQAQQAALMNMADEYGVPFAELQSLNPANPYEAEKHILNSRLETEKKEKSDLMKRLEKLEATLTAQSAESMDSPDLGGGSPTTMQSQLQQQYDQALANRDHRAAEQISGQAAGANIRLDTRPLQIR